MNKNKDQAFIGGAAVHKELQGFAAFLAYQSCHQDGGSITKAMMEASMGLKLILALEHNRHYS